MKRVHRTGCELDGAAEILHGLVVLLGSDESKAAINERVEVHGVERQRLGQGGDGGLGPLQFQQCVAIAAPGIRRKRIHRHGARQKFLRLFVAPLPALDASQHEQRIEMRRRAFEKLAADLRRASAVPGLGKRVGPAHGLGGTVGDRFHAVEGRAI